MTTRTTSYWTRGQKQRALFLGYGSCVFAHVNAAVRQFPVEIGVKTMRKIILLILLIFVTSFSVFGQRAWTKNGGVNIATSSAAIPAFPRTLSGYRSAGNGKDFWGNAFDWEGSIRVFEGEDWTGI